jgi:Tfp pilus assembly protein PilF
LRDAERAFQRAIRTYEQENDSDGVAYALGRQGYCYEQSGEVEKALATYRRAVDLETDIPAIYHGLISLLVAMGDLDEAFLTAERWRQHGGIHITGTPYQIFIGLGAGLTREKSFEEAIALLSRTVAAISHQDFPEEHWAATGRLAYAYEKAGKLDAAMETCSAAIKAGTNDRQTYARYLMYLQKQKQYEQALAIIQQGLKVQRDAAWEADLRKRQQRIEREAGLAPKDAPLKIIPVFSVRHGKQSVSLLRQVKFSPQLTNLCAGQQVVYASSAGKGPMLRALEIENASAIWEVDLPEPTSGIVVAGDSIVTYAQEGRVGDGATILRFFDSVGREICNHRLPDAPSDVVSSGELVYAGCRDGRLYAFSSQGRRLWSYEVPAGIDAGDSAYMRPCPYYVRAASNQVVFSTFSEVFAVDTRGKLRWRWSTPERKSRSRGQHVEVTMILGPASVRGLATSEDGLLTVVTAGDTIHELIAGKTKTAFKRKVEVVGSAAVDSEGSLWAVGADDHVLVLRNGRPAGRFNAPSGAFVSINPTADRILAWSGNELSIADTAAKLIANIEFVKRVSYAVCIDDRRVVVGAGHLVILDTGCCLKAGEGVRADSRATRKAPSRPRAPERRMRHTEEDGVPVRWIEGDKLDTGAGKAFYTGPGAVPLTIEELALEHYRVLGWTGEWTENEYWWAIMALLFWDVIFARVPGVFSPSLGGFPSAMQDMPRDLFTTDFYPRREKLIEKRIVELTRPRMFGLTKTNIEAELRSAFSRHKGEPCRPIDWARLPDVDTLITATRVLTDQQLTKILRHLLENFSDNRRGLPDLFLAQHEKALFVEVKSEREQVRQHQIDWMLYLRNKVGVDVEICRVISE